jgi:hypothetical protein
LQTRSTTFTYHFFYLPLQAPGESLRYYGLALSAFTSYLQTMCTRRLQLNLSFPPTWSLRSSEISSPTHSVPILRHSRSNARTRKVEGNCGTWDSRLATLFGVWLQTLGSRLNTAGALIHRRYMMRAFRMDIGGDMNADSRRSMEFLRRNQVLVMVLMMMSGG